MIGIQMHHGDKWWEEREWEAPKDEGGDEDTNELGGNTTKHNHHSRNTFHYIFDIQSIMLDS